MNQQPNDELRRAQSRRPITAEEVPHLEQMGAYLRSLREDRDLRRTDISPLALVGVDHLHSIERGLRRTRRSTLERIVNAIADVSEDEHLDRDFELAMLVRLVGPALAPDSPWQARVERRARRRYRRKAQGLIDEARVEQRARMLAEQWLAEGRW